MALQASLIIRELIDQHIDGKSLLTTVSKEKGDDATYNAELKPVQTACTTLYNFLSASSLIQNIHALSVVSSLFLKLGKYPSFKIRILSL